MHNDSLPDDADFLAASAVAALAIAVTAAERVKGDSTLAAWVREVGELPSWRDNAREWVRGLRALQKKYNLPSEDELSGRTIQQSLFSRVRSSALGAASSGDLRARHFHLSMASIAAGSLFGVSHGIGAQATDIETAVQAALSQQAAKATASRKKVQAMGQVKTKFDEWQANPGKHSEWHTFKDFGRWAEKEHGLDSGYVARKAGRWKRALD
jgi:hypothetical protein